MQMNTNKKINHKTSNLITMLIITFFRNILRGMPYFLIKVISNPNILYIHGKDTSKDLKKNNNKKVKCDLDAKIPYKKASESRNVMLGIEKKHCMLCKRSAKCKKAL